MLQIDYERRKKRATDLIDDATKPGSTVTDEQLSKAVSALLGIERQEQLLGFDDDTSGAEAMQLLSEAIEVSYERRKAFFRKLSQKTKSFDNKVTRKQISDALAEVLSAGRGRQVLGGDTDKTDQEISDLLDQAVKISGEREKPAPDRPGHVDARITKRLDEPRLPRLAST